MKIGFVIYNLSRGVGGIQRAGTSLANAMQQRGHECTVFINDYKKRPPLYSLDEGVSVKYLDMIDNSGSRARTRRTVLAAAPDVLVLMTSSDDLTAWPVILRDTDIPMVVSERTDPVVAQSFFSTLSERYAILSTAAQIHVQTQRGRECYPDSLRDRVVVIPNSVQPAQRQVKVFSNSPGTKRIVHVGRIHDVCKQQRLLVKAFSVLATEYPEWELHFWGDGTAEEERLLNETIDVFGVGEQTFVNGVTDAVDEKLLQAQLFVFPSKYEGFPNALLEAQAHGLPAVGYRNCGGTNEIITDGLNGLLFDELTPESLAEKMRALMADEKLRKKMGQAAFEVSQNYTPDRIFDEFDAFFQKTPNLPVDKAAETIKDPEISNQLDRIFSSEYLHKSKTPPVRPVPLGFLEDSRKRFSRRYVKPIRDFLQALKKK